MLPARLLLYSVHGAQLVPRYLTAADHPWLRRLLDTTAQHVGRPERDLRERLRDPLPCAAPPRELQLASHVLQRACGPGRPREPAPRAVREAVFGEAAASGAPRSEVIARAAAALGSTPHDVEAALLSDLPGQRPLGPLPAGLGPAELALRCNLALAQALLCRCTRLRVTLRGNARAVVRQARLHGLICTVRATAQAKTAAGAAGEGATLELSGPLSLFRRTRIYGRALGALLPLLPWCDHYALEAECVLVGQPLKLVIGSGDPLPPGTEPRRFDSEVERRFAADFGKLAPEWDVVREPEPLAADGSLIFVDFALVHRPSGERFYLEIAGFWTPGYLERKLAQHRAAGLGERLVLCIDAQRPCAEEDLPAGSPVLRYKRRVDAAAVLDVLQRRLREVLTNVNSGLSR